MLTNFIDNDGNNTMEGDIDDNYNQIKLGVKEIVEQELERIKNDENLKHLISK